MTHWFDDIARLLAAGASRRQVLKLLATGTVDGMLSTTFGNSLAARAQAQGATMTVLRGQVGVLHPDGTAVQPAPSGTTVFPGDEIRTLSQTGALITFFSGTEIELGEETILVVEAVSRQGERVDVSLRQVFGAAVSRVQTFADPGSSYRIEAGGAVAVARGSDLGTRVESLQFGWFAAFVCCSCGPRDMLTARGRTVSLFSPGGTCIGFAVRTEPTRSGSWNALSEPLAIGLPGGVGPWDGPSQVTAAGNANVASEEQQDEEQEHQDDDGGGDNGGGGAGGVCNASTCASGCCQNGTCRSGNTSSACGTGGGMCAQCSGSCCAGQCCPSGCFCQQNLDCIPPGPQCFSCNCP